MATVTAIYIGVREAMVAEVAAFDPTVACGISRREAKYLVMPIGDATWDTSWAPNRVDAKSIAREMAAYYGVPVVWAH